MATIRFDRLRTSCGDSPRRTTGLGDADDATDVLMPTSRIQATTPTRTWTPNTNVRFLDASVRVAKMDFFELADCASVVGAVMLARAVGHATPSEEIPQVACERMGWVAGPKKIAGSQAL